MDQESNSDQQSHADKDKNEGNEEEWTRLKDSGGLWCESKELEGVWPWECLTHDVYEVKLEVECGIVVADESACVRSEEIVT